MVIMSEQIEQNAIFLAREILKAKDKIMQAVDDGYGTNRKNLKMRNLRFLIKDFWNGFKD